MVILSMDSALNVKYSDVVPWPLFSDDVVVADGRTLQKYTDRIMLDFDVAYKLECSITHGNAANNNPAPRWQQTHKGVYQV